MASCLNHVLLILSNTSTKAGMAVESKCGTWACVDCGEDLRHAWLAKASRIFAALAMWEYSVCNGHQFTALTGRLRKAGKVYFRIRIAGVSHVFHQPLIQTRQYTPDPSKWLGSEATVKAFTAVLFLPGVSRVSCSRSLIPPKPAKVKTDWRRESVKRKTVNQVNQFLERLLIGQTIAHAKAFDGRLLDVILLRDFPVFSPSKTTSPRISSKAADGMDKTSETRTTRPVDDDSESSWGDIRTALLVT